jgi:hypothetical protein
MKATKNTKSVDYSSNIVKKLESFSKKQQNLNKMKIINVKDKQKKELHISTERSIDKYEILNTNEDKHKTPTSPKIVNFTPSNFTINNKINSDILNINYLRSNFTTKNINNNNKREKYPKNKLKIETENEANLLNDKPGINKLTKNFSNMNTNTNMNSNTTNNTNAGYKKTRQNSTGGGGSNNNFNLFLKPKICVNIINNNNNDNYLTSNNNNNNKVTINENFNNAKKNKKGKICKIIH